MSVFEGGNLEGWVVRAEILFSMHRLSKMEKLDVATLSFNDEAWAWFQWENKRRKILSWDELKSRLLAFWLNSRRFSFREVSSTQAKGIGEGIQPNFLGNGVSTAKGP